MIKRSIKMKTDYLDDYRLISDVPALTFFLITTMTFILIPFLVSERWLSAITHIALYSIAVLGQNILIGYTGLISLGQSGFLAIGAYTFAHAYLTLGLIPSIFLGGLVSSLFGLIVGFPSLRLKGPYLAIATLGFSVAVFQVLQNAPFISGGRMGMRIPVSLDKTQTYYIIVAFSYLFFIWGYKIVKSKIGKSFSAVRDSEVASQTLGIDIVKVKLISFFISSFYTGVAGALYAIYMKYLEPTMFFITESIQMFSAIIIGGIGSVLGSILGSVFVIVVPQIFVGAKELVPVIFGIAIIFVVMFEPLGLYGRWIKIKLYFMNFPFR